MGWMYDVYKHSGMKDAVDLGYKVRGLIDGSTYEEKKSEVETEVDTRVKGALQYFFLIGLSLIVIAFGFALLYHWITA